MNYKETKNLYAKIFKLVDGAGEEIIEEFARLKAKAEEHLYGIELCEKYGFDSRLRKPIRKDWHELNHHTHIGFFDGQRRNIAWSDDGKQPKDEYLLRISFPTGAYTFGSWCDDYYPVGVFNDFFCELKAFGPKYSDSHNHNLYFELSNAANVFNNFDEIFVKYREIAKNDYKRQKAEKLRKQAEALENS